MFNFERVLLFDVLLRKHVERLLHLLFLLVLHLFASFAAFAFLDRPQENKEENKDGDTDHDDNGVIWQTKQLWPLSEGIGARTKLLVTDVWGADDAFVADVELDGLLRAALRVIRSEDAEEFLEKDATQCYGVGAGVLDRDSACIADGLREGNQGNPDVGCLVCCKI